MWLLIHKDKLNIVSIVDFGTTESYVQKELDRTVNRGANRAEFRIVKYDLASIDVVAVLQNHLNN